MDACTVTSGTIDIAPVVAADVLNAVGIGIYVRDSMFGKFGIFMIHWHDVPMPDSIRLFGYRIILIRKIWQKCGTFTTSKHMML